MTAKPLLIPAWPVLSSRTEIVLPVPVSVTNTDCVNVPPVKLFEIVGVIVPAVVERFTGLANAVTVLLLASCAVSVMLKAVPATWLVIVEIAK